MFPSIQQSVLDLKQEVSKAISNLRVKSPDFEFAYDTYVQEYGEAKLFLGSEPTDLSDTIDKVAITLGRTCTVFYSDSKRSLRGNFGEIKFQPGACYIVGRRQPQDQRLVCWTPEVAVELEEYDSRASIIPSRVHCAFIYSESGVKFLDLGSSSGTVLVGESSGTGPFVIAYDPGAVRPSIRFDRISTARLAYQV